MMRQINATLFENFHIFSSFFDSLIVFQNYLSLIEKIMLWWKCTLAVGPSFMGQTQKDMTHGGELSQRQMSDYSQVYHVKILTRSTLVMSKRFHTYLNFYEYCKTHRGISCVSGFKEYPRVTLQYIDLTRLRLFSVMDDQKMTLSKHFIGDLNSC